jgi:hypothetical protein
VLERIVLEARQAAVPAKRPAPRRRVSALWYFGSIGTAAAAVFVALLVSRPTSEIAPSKAQPEVSRVKMLRVASDADVEVVSMDAADVDILVVGDPPLRGPFVLAGPGDVSLDSIEPDPTDGMMPEIRMENNPHGPMIVAPLGVALNRP